MYNQDQEAPRPETRPRGGPARQMWRLGAGGAVTAALIAGGVALAGGLPVPSATPAAASSAAQNLTTTALASGSTGTTPSAPGAPGGWGRGGKGHGHFGPGGFGGPAFGGFGRAGRELKVTAVNGNTIDATTESGQAVTVTVSASTTYSEDNASAALSDVHAGSLIAARGTRSSANTLAATSVTIVLPREAGVVTAVNGSTLTLTGLDGATHSVTVGSSTKYDKAGQTALLSDVATGTAVVAEGTLNADGSLSATRVSIQVPRIVGRVTAVNSSSISVAGPFGTTYTVMTSSSTTYAGPGGASATASSVQSGDVIMAEGTLSADGTTLTALRITVMPAPPAGPGDFGGWGGANGTPGGTGSSGNASNAAPTTGSQNI